MHYNYANFLRDTSKFNLAKYHYREALKLWPNYPSALNNLGTIIENDIEAQEQHFLAAIRFSDQHLNAHFNLGQLYRFVLFLILIQTKLILCSIQFNFFSSLERSFFVVFF